VKVLLFSPVSSIWNHKTIEIALSRALHKLGHEVFELQCDGALAPQCIAFSEAGIQAGAATHQDVVRICGLCKSRALTSLKISKNQDGGNLGALTTGASAKGEIRTDLPFPQSVEKWPKSLREASYETLVERKSSDLILDLETQNLIARAEENWLQAFEKTAESIVKLGIDFLVLTDAHYSINAGAWAAAQKFGIRTATIGSALDFRNNGNSFSLFSSVDDQALITRSKAWNDIRETPLSTSDILEVKRNLKYLLSAKSAFTYSTGFRKVAKEKVKDTIAVDRKRPLVLVVTTTRDERFAAQVAGKLPRIQGPRNFDSQIDFLEQVVATAKNLPEISFVVRLHPRLLPNKRDGIKSDYAEELENALRNPPPNLRINFPSQNLSLADVGLASDLVLNWTSTAGLDLLALGVPVVSCEPNETLAYPPDIGIELGKGSSLAETILAHLGQPLRVELAVEAFRFKTFLSKHLTVKIHRGASKRTRITPFRILNWVRVRGKGTKNGFVFSLIDLFDGLRFVVRKKELTRIRDFFASDSSHLPVIENKRVPSKAMEHEEVRRILVSLRRN
jgi:hypothetical protein